MLITHGKPVLVGEIFSFELDNFNPDTLVFDEFLLHVRSKSSDKLNVA